jgi:hypothetical protein
MGDWEFIAVLIIFLALLGAKEVIKSRQSPVDQETARRGLLLGLILFVAGLAWLLGLQAH